MQPGKHSPIPPPAASLAPALAAARRALQRMDETEVPARLRRVSRLSGSLPPPMARVLTAELEESEWLRGKALEQWEGERSGPAYLFLTREPGWEEAVAEAVDTAGVEHEAKTNRALQRRLRAAEERIARLEELVREGREEVERVRRETAEEMEGERRRLAAANSRLRSELAEVRDERDRLARQAAEVTVTGPPSRRPARPAPPPVTVSEKVVGRGNPVEMAKTLDSIVGSLAVPVVVATESSPEEGFRLRGGIRPDRPEAVAALVAWRGPVRLLVDGFNLAYAMGAPIDTDGRKRVEAHLRNLRHVAVGRLTVEVIWDSGEEDSMFLSDGIEVAYAGVADDEIVRRIDGRASTVVVSSDREVQQRSAEKGAEVVWSEAVAGWRS